MRGARLLIDWSVIATLATVIVLALGWFGFATRADNLLYDRLLSFRAPPPSDQIIIVQMDNRSLQVLGKWPWPRRTHAHVLTQLAKAHPRAIAYDVLFTEPSDDDATLAQAMRTAGHVYLPLLIDASGVSGSGVSVVGPAPLLSQAAAGVGQVNVLSDRDSIVRRADPILAVNDKNWPHLMTLLVPPTNVPKQTFPISFQPSIDSFRTVSFVDVYNGEVPDVFLHDKIILIGASGDGMGDQFSVPVRYGGKMTGIDLQANMLNTMLSGAPITLLPSWLSALLALVPVWILLASLWRWRPGTLLLISLGLLLGCVMVSAGLFFGFGLWWPPTAALLGLAFVYPLWGWRRLAALSNMVDEETRAYRQSNAFTGHNPHPRQPSDQIERQTRDLQSAFARGRAIEQSAQDREQALQLLSHDMRAPQASIITLLESEARDLPAGLKARVTGYARRTLALADNFVQLARVQESPFRPEEANLCDLLNEAIDELYPLYAARDIHVTADGLDEPCYINAEPALLVRVLINVIDNAIKYSTDGSSIHCSIVYDGHDVRCLIADQGVGMTPAQIDGLFERFSPIGRERHTGSAGSGLGLALVKFAVERHGGRVTCASTVGKGTVFTLSFPAID